ncbi:MAG: transposase [Blastocatellales bacterium]
MYEKPWPHAPAHRLTSDGVYIVTAATLYKENFFQSPEKLTLLESSLLALAKEYGWGLEAWAVFPNHYHFVAHSEVGGRSIRELIHRLHSLTAWKVNQMDRAKGRKVWHNYWETKLTFQKSYLARLSYVHRNAVKHGLVSVASQYPWCSASWFERTATPAFRKTLYEMKIDRVNVRDDF